MDLNAQVPADLVDLLSTYRERRRREVAELEAAVDGRDIDMVRHLGERMFAVGNPYGFRQITTFGRQIRDACSVADFDAIGNVIRQYDAYLRDVSINVVAVPTPRLKCRKSGAVRRTTATP